MDLFQKSLVGQNIITDPPMYECMERVLTCDAKAELLQQNNLVGSHTVVNFTTVMNMMTAHIFSTYENCDQRQYIQRFLRQPPEMKVHTFNTKLSQLNTYLAYVPPDYSEQQRDSILNRLHNIKWEAAKKHKQDLINEGNAQENKKHKTHAYQTGDKVLLRNACKTKLNQKAYLGSYMITAVRDNGTVRSLKGRIKDAFNIRSLIPYKEYRHRPI